MKKGKDRNELKVVPIGGRHKSFNSLCGEAMDRKEWVRGFVIGFTEDGTMHFGEFGAVTADVGMAQMYMQKLAVEFMA